MSKKILSIIVILLSITNAFAQNVAPYKIEGTVLNEANSPIEMGNVIALFKKDSSIIKGNYFIDGTYVLEGLRATEFLLKITALGYTEAYIAVEN